MPLRLLCLALLTAAAHAAPASEPSADDIAAMLPESPRGFGRPASDRKAWADLAGAEVCREAVERAEEHRKAPVPVADDALYLDFSRTGNRSRYQRVVFRRLRRLVDLVLAECARADGRYVDAIAATVAAYDADRSWLLPAHDRGLANFRGERVDIDLMASHVGHNLAMAAWLLDDRLGEPTRRLIDENLRRRIVTPYLDMIAGRRKPNWWITCTNNWNAVCHAGVVGTALATVEDRPARARIAAAAIKNSRRFLAGFTDDGYCSEGVSYWNYGFGYFTLLAECIRQHTGGRVDMLAWPASREPAAFGRRIEIHGGVYPAFADCPVGRRPSATLRHFLGRRFGWGAPPEDDALFRRADGRLPHVVMHLFPNAATQAPPPTKPRPPLPPRTWFDDAGILICRPGDNGARRLAVALKGGHNGEHHNHNDVGSYVAVVEDAAILLDPGSEVYTARTFSKRRYESNVLNSFGHPVPRLAGRLQQAGGKARAKVLSTDFTDEADTLTLDLTSAYDVKQLARLTRTFVYDRGGDGSLTVTDEAELNEPAAFETALITADHWKRQGDAALLVYDVRRAVRVTIDTAGAGFELDETVIDEDVNGGIRPRRIAVRLAEPARRAKVTMMIVPADNPLTADGPLANGGFEHGSLGWRLSDDGMSEVSTKQAASGKRSLRVHDASGTDGSSVRSHRIAVPDGRKLRLEGKARVVSGSGVGVYVYYYDAGGRRLNETDARGHVAPVLSLDRASDAFRPFAADLDVPDGATELAIWIHSYNSARVTAYIDDLAVREFGN